MDGVTSAQPIELGRLARAAQARQVIDAAVTFIADHALPFSTFTLESPAHSDGRPAVRVGWFRDGALLMWARALGVDTVHTEDRDWCTLLELSAAVGAVQWRVEGQLDRPAHGPRLGGAAVTRAKRANGGRSQYGTVTVDELAAGMARMGIPELVAPGRATADHVGGA